MIFNVCFLCPLFRPPVAVSCCRCSGAIADFFNYVPLIVTIVSATCKRNDVLMEKHQKVLLEKLENGVLSTGTGLNQATSLARPGDTRCGSHLKILLRIYQMRESVLAVLEIICKDAAYPSGHGGAAGLIQEDGEL